jgi:hypothetical protein
MKTYEVQKELPGSGEYILGAEQTGSHACYLIYGTMKPKEKGRELKPGKGHEELFLAVKGDFAVPGHMTGIIREGQAVHLIGDETRQIENTSDSEAIYVIAGGHSSDGHH